MSEEVSFPETIGATVVEAAFIWGTHEVLAPLAGLAATAIGRYLVSRQERAKEVLRSELERAGATARVFKDADQFAASALRYTRAASSSLVRSTSDTRTPASQEPPYGPGPA
jgi:hypothetical protein